MPQTFWQARLPMQADALEHMARAFDPALLAAIERGISGLAVIELICDEASPGRMALLISAEGASRQQGDLTCWMAFSNDQAWCNNFRMHGIPMVEADIETTRKGTVRVRAAAYPVRAMAHPITLRELDTLTLEGVDLDPDDDSTFSDAWAPSYRQFRSAPDIAMQTTDLSVAHFTWTPLRRSLRVPAGNGVRLAVSPASWPALAEVLCPDGTAQVGQGFTGLLAGRFLDTEAVFARAPDFAELRESPFSRWPRSAPAPGVPVPSPAPRVARLPAASIFGAPHFEFEDVDVVGFRLPLPDSAMPRLQALVEPLNFHRSADGAMDDFSWRVATPTVIIEMLRYGKMRTRSPLAPLEPADFMTQHELLVRLLVGKLDDDGSQARDASLYVPAIFVDNPWSKMVGRESQGFTKELAQFCIRDEAGEVRPLDMAGAWDKKPHPLSRVVHLRTPPGFRDAASHPLLDLSFPVRPGDDSRFEQVDLNAILGTPVPGFSRWRQSDFDGREFRRSFARQAMSSGFSGFRTVQATPVDSRGLPPAWIYGRMQINSMQALFPPGVATLALSCEGRPKDGARPDAWRALCELLGGDEVNLPAGDWYWLKMNLTMNIQSSLDW